MSRKFLSSSKTQCTDECQSTEHADELIAVITLPRTGILDRQVASYCKSKCSNFAKLRDYSGRTLLHVAASCGRRDLCLWLLKLYSRNIDATDDESGYTALHRSIAYGFIDVSVALIQNNANLNIEDREDLCPLDILRRDIDLMAVDYILFAKFPPDYLPTGHPKPLDSSATRVESLSLSRSTKKFKTSYEEFMLLAEEKLATLSRLLYGSATEVYTWGTNSNYTSGFDLESGKSKPEFLGFFEKLDEMIVEISMNKFHTLFVSLNGRVWSCGIGHGGRLGLSSEKIVLIPEQITLNIPSVTNLFCITAAAGQDHSIFLCNNNLVLVCGTNTYHQLGLSPPPSSVTKPVPVDIPEFSGFNILGVAASDCHSVVWTSFTLYTCGLHAGQLGHPKSSEVTIPTFKKVALINFSHTSILTVTVTNGATLIATENNIFIMTNYKFFTVHLKPIIKGIHVRELLRDLKNMRIQYQNERSIIKLSAIGGQLDREKTKLFPNISCTKKVQFAVILHDGSLYYWKNDTNKLLMCSFLSKYRITVTDVILNSSGMFISTRKGELLKAIPKTIAEYKVPVKDDFIYVNHVGVESTRCYVVQTEKIRGAYRTVSIFSDPKGDNFAILQHRSAGTIMPIPISTESTLKVDLIAFYRETEECDNFHDIIFKVGNKSFAAHKYILASCSKMFLKFPENDGVVVIDDISPSVFETFLEFAYTGNCRIRKEVQSMSNARNNLRTSFQDEPILKQVIRVAEKFHLDTLVKFLGKIKPPYTGASPESNLLINREVVHAPTFDRLKFSSLYDIKLKSQDGPVFHAHKCMLVARLEYFKNMLSGYWIESTDRNQEFNMPVNSAVLSELLNFLYTDKISKPTGKKDSQFWGSLLVAADQFLLKKLRGLSERAISMCLDIRNVIDYTMLANMVNADQLKIACFQFISVNLPSILYYRQLERMDDTLLQELTRYYRYSFRDFRYRKFAEMSVYGDFCDLDEIFTAEKTYPVDWDVIYDIDNEEKNIKKFEKRKHKKKQKKMRKSSTSEAEMCLINEHKSDLKINDSLNCDVIDELKNLKVSEMETETPKSKKEKWVSVDRQVKLVKSRLKANATAKEFPELIEQKENFIPLTPGKSPTSPRSSEGFELSTFSPQQDNVNFSLNIDVTSLTPRMSQAERKRLRKLGESNKNDASTSPTEYGDKKKSPLVLSIENGSGSPTTMRCWKIADQTIDESASFSSIMASEKKQKTLVIKETKKLETKSLSLTQIEEQAIQELMIFYNTIKVDDEHITIQRVVYQIDAPQWITK